MLARGNRLSRRGDILRVRRSRIDGDVITLKAVFTEQKRPFRAAVVVGKKISKKAVDRNLIQRRIREAIRAEADRIPDGSDLMFIGKAAPEKCEYAKILTDVQMMADKLTGARK